MTDQASERLDNAHPDVDFGPLRLYRVITGDIATNHGWGVPYPYSSPPNLPDSRIRNSAIARGYIAHYSLSADGRLTLNSYTYPSVPPLSRDIVETVNEPLTGDFWLVMKPYFRDPRTYVPFRDGVIVVDQSEWQTPT